MRKPLAYAFGIGRIAVVEVALEGAAGSAGRT